MKAAAQPKAMMPKTEPLDFLRPFDLVINPFGFGVELIGGYTMDTVGTRMIEAREMKGLTVQQLSELTEVSAGNISGFENDCYVPSFSVLIPICRILECSVDWLLAGSAFGTPKAGREPSCDDVPLSQLELDLVAMFRHLKEHDRKNAFDFVALLYEQGEGKADSAYSTYPNEDSKRTSSTLESNEGTA